MRITIDTHAATPAEMGICIATLVACGASAPDVARDTAVPMTTPNAWHVVELVSALAERITELTAHEITRLLDLLNTELYSRRIPTADNPESGADAAALNSDASGFTKDELTAKFNNEIVKPLLAPMVAVVEKLDLAGVFGGAGGGVVSDDTAKAVNADLQGAVDTLIDRGRETPSNVALDRAGIPWDSRIHSASKSINQTDGLWRQKRGVSPELVATVVGQLKQAQSVPGVGTHGSAELDADAAKLTAMGGDAGLTIEELGGVTGQLVKIPPPPPVAAAPSAPPLPPTDTGEIDSLPRLLKFITEQKLAGKINQAQVQQALIALGIEGPLPVLQSRPDLIPEMVKKLRAIGGL